MSYYAVLEMTNTLVAQNRWTLQRCRRRCDGPARYIIVDATNTPVITDSSNRTRRLGFTLSELLMLLHEQGGEDLAGPAGDLLKQLNDVTEYE